VSGIAAHLKQHKQENGATDLLIIYDTKSARDKN